MFSKLARSRLRAALVAAAVAAVIAVASSVASGSPSTTQASRTLWATINVCKSSHPRLGVRGQMPGDGTHEQMFIRFTAQFHNSSGWHALGGRARSPWVHAGSAFNKFQQTGWTFDLNKPSSGSSFLLRGFVEFQWRSGSRVVRRAHTNTKGGHPGTVGAQPRNFSAATCRVHG